MTTRVCTTPGCPRLVSRGYCPEHAATSSRNHHGVPPQQRGYDAAYRAERATLLGQPCALRLPGCTGVATTADHVVPIARGGAGGSLRPACSHCNSSRGAGRSDESTPYPLGFLGEIGGAIPHGNRFPVRTHVRPEAG